MKRYTEIHQNLFCETWKKNIYICHYICSTVYTVYTTYIDLKESRHHLSPHHERVFESQTAATDWSNCQLLLFRSAATSARANDRRANTINLKTRLFSICIGAAWCDRTREFIGWRRGGHKSPGQKPPWVRSPLKIAIPSSPTSNLPNTNASPSQKYKVRGHDKILTNINVRRK